MSVSVNACLSLCDRLLTYPASRPLSAGVGCSPSCDPELDKWKRMGQWRDIIRRPLLQCRLGVALPKCWWSFFDNKSSSQDLFISQFYSYKLYITHIIMLICLKQLQIIHFTWDNHVKTKSFFKWVSGHWFASLELENMFCCCFTFLLTFILLVLLA